MDATDRESQKRQATGSDQAAGSAAPSTGVGQPPAGSSDPELDELEAILAEATGGSGAALSERSAGSPAEASASAPSDAESVLSAAMAELGELERATEEPGVETVAESLVQADNDLDTLASSVADVDRELDELTDSVNEAVGSAEENAPVEPPASIRQSDAPARAGAAESGLSLLTGSSLRDEISQITQEVQSISEQMTALLERVGRVSHEADEKLTRADAFRDAAEVAREAGERFAAAQSQASQAQLAYEQAQAQLEQERAAWEAAQARATQTAQQVG